MRSTSSPLISVLFPVRNAERYLETALQSLFQQSFSNFEILVIDDASTDRTPEILERLRRQDSRLHILKNPTPQGISRSCNRAAQQARGPYLARMDADDIALPDRFAKQFAWMESHPDCVAVGGQTIRIDPDGWPIDHWRMPTQHEEIDRWLLSGRGGGIIHPTAMIRAEAFWKVGGYDETLDASQDYDLWLKLGEIGRLANLPDIVLYYRLHLTSVTCSRQLRQALCKETALYRACKRRGVAEPLGRPSRPKSEITPQRARRQWIRAALRSGCYETARKHARILWRERPWDPIAFGLFFISQIATLLRPSILSRPISIDSI